MSETTKFEINSTSTYASEEFSNPDFYKIKTAALSDQVKDKIENEEIRKLAVLKISNTFRSIKTNKVNGINFTLAEELSRVTTDISLVQVYFPPGNQNDWVEGFYSRTEGSLKVLHLQKRNTSQLNKHLLFHKALKIANGVAKTSVTNNWSNDSEDQVFVEFAESQFMIGYYYLQPNGDVIFEDLGDHLEMFEDILDEEIKKVVYFYKDKQFDGEYLEEFIKTM